MYINKNDKSEGMRMEKTIALADEKPLGIKDAMELTGYSRGHIYRLIRFGQMPCHKPTRGRLFFKKK
jgi:predicted DNA-binding transcriptional regulator AlpA